MEMAESFETLAGLPRVPKADEAGVQTGRGIPPRKRYRGNIGIVDAEEAASLYKKRVRGEIPPIAGGIDDDDPRLYDENSTITGRQRPAQHSALTEDDVEALKLGRSDGPNAVPYDPPAVVAVRTVPHETAAVPDPAAYPDQDVPCMGGPAGRARDPDPVPARVVERIVEKPVDRVVEKVVERKVEVPVETAFSKWSSKRTRVEIATPDTTFNISAVSVIRSAHGVVVVLPTSNDSMTFVPKTGSRVTVGNGDLGVVETIYTGVSFDIPDLSIMGLCFLVPKSGAREG